MVHLSLFIYLFIYSFWQFPDSLWDCIYSIRINCSTRMVWAIWCQLYCSTICFSDWKAAWERRIERNKNDWEWYERRNHPEIEIKIFMISTNRQKIKRITGFSNNIRRFNARTNDALQSLWRLDFIRYRLAGSLPLADGAHTLTRLTYAGTIEWRWHKVDLVLSYQDAFKYFFFSFFSSRRQHLKNAVSCGGKMNGSPALPDDRFICKSEGMLK